MTSRSIPAADHRLRSAQTIDKPRSYILNLRKNRRPRHAFQHFRGTVQKAEFRSLHVPLNEIHTPQAKGAAVVPRRNRERQHSRARPPIQISSIRNESRASSRSHQNHQQARSTSTAPPHPCAHPFGAALAASYSAIQTKSNTTRPPHTAVPKSTTPHSSAESPAPPANAKHSPK
jgi:hypothetical protein